MLHKPRKKSLCKVITATPGYSGKKHSTGVQVGNALVQNEHTSFHQSLPRVSKTEPQFTYQTNTKVPNKLLSQVTLTSTLPFPETCSVLTDLSQRGKQS